VCCLPCLLLSRLALAPGTVQMNEFLKLVLQGLPAAVPPHSDGEGGCGKGRGSLTLSHHHKLAMVCA